MSRASIAPNIAVIIGGELRVYLAFVTTADPSLDGPSTVTLYTSSLSDVSGWAADPITYDAAFANLPARLVLIESSHRDWHRASYGEQHCIFAPADPVLASVEKLQSWLWKRLQARTACEVA